ncbi:MAG: HAMP domain-containing histidine kinase [Oscillospiraceae bacterium]|nr:HAMP domain-containing histidine kinase [Oscillospiraceae bacterium]
MRRKTLLKKLDKMLDEAISGAFEAQSYDESQLSKIEAKTARFLELSRLKREQIDGERERVRALISDISHQTKTPLANISLYTGLLSEEDLSDSQKRLTAQISASADKLEFLIGSLVKVSRLESGIIKIEALPGNVFDLINSAVSECENLAADKRISLNFPENQPPLTALFDTKWCGETLFNIIENAVKYTPENGSVSVSVTEYEMFVRIDISDTGRGIREEDLPKVFTRFWRAAESADSQGVGIGLYLARQIITACGGYIKVSSGVGKGAVFSLFLTKL